MGVDDLLVYLCNNMTLKVKILTRMFTLSGIEMVCAFYACLYIAAIPVLVRPPQQPRSSLLGGSGGGGGSANNTGTSTSGGSGGGGFFGGSSLDLSASRSSLEPSPPPAQICFADSVTMAWNVVSSSQAVACLTQASIIKLIKSKVRHHEHSDYTTQLLKR